MTFSQYICKTLLFVYIYYIQIANCKLKCYDCHMTKRCNDPIDWTNMDVNVCEALTVSRRPNTIFFDAEGSEIAGRNSVNETQFNREGKDNIKKYKKHAEEVIMMGGPACIKVVIKRAKQSKRTARMCVPKAYFGKGICNFPQIAVGRVFKNEVISCSACTEHFCNTSKPISSSSVLVVATVLFCILRRIYP